METLLIDRSDGVVTVTMNRPERKNAFTGTMIEEMLDVVDEISTSSDDRVLVLTGAGDAFSSGADLAENPVSNGLTSMRRVGDLVLALHRLAKPTIARVNGVAVGMSCSLALGCDLIVASSTARFSEIFTQRGMSLDGGASWVLPRLVGLHRAKEIAFFGDLIAAGDALAMGLVNRVVEPAELDTVVGEWARRLASGPPIALSMTKTMLNNSFSSTMAEAVEDEARCQIVNAGTEDLREAVTAFLEKRPAVFRGR
jgi:2-(1,2-epoxy-1,2-dihydrophenyl)acetyl-CoA isomerase